MFYIFLDINLTFMLKKAVTLLYGRFHPNTKLIFKN